jgi:hypothetical protein
VTRDDTDDDVGGGGGDDEDHQTSHYWARIWILGQCYILCCRFVVNSNRNLHSLGWPVCLFRVSFHLIVFLPRLTSPFHKHMTLWSVPLAQRCLHFSSCRSVLPETDDVSLEILNFPPSRYLFSEMQFRVGFVVYHGYGGSCYFHPQFSEMAIYFHAGVSFGLFLYPEVWLTLFFDISVRFQRPIELYII